MELIWHFGIQTSHTSVWNLVGVVPVLLLSRFCSREKTEHEVTGGGCILFGLQVRATSAEPGTWTQISATFLGKQIGEQRVERGVIRE